MICDEVSENQYAGSLGSLSYLLKSVPKVMLVGHVHNPSMGMEGNSVIINSGNLGRYGQGTFGTFADFELDEKNAFQKANFYEIADLGKNDIKKVGEFAMTEKGLERIGKTGEKAEETKVQDKS